MITGSFGRKSRGRDLGKKQSVFKRGLKALGTVALVGAGVATAVHAITSDHKNHDAEQQKSQQLEEHSAELAAQGAKPAPPPAVEFGQSGTGSTLDKAQDVLAVAGAGLEAAQDVAAAEGKLGKAKAVAQGAKAVVGAAKEVGAKDKQAKFESGALTDEQAKKFAGKQMKQAEADAKRRHCDDKYPKGVGNKKARAKTAARRKVCYKTGS